MYYILYRVQQRFSGNKRELEGCRFFMYECDPVKVIRKFGYNDFSNSANCTFYADRNLVYRKPRE